MGDIVRIISSFGSAIDDIEINKGTLNDVFIAITGKEIRA
jgi:ABC-2 type transport system ATP-binding protein